MPPREFARPLLLAALCVAACTPVADPPDTPDPLSRPAANHNRVVGTYTGTTTLPDGRALALELVLDRDGFATGRYTLDATAFDFVRVGYDLRDATLKLGDSISVNVTPEGTALVLHGLPSAAGWTRVFVRAAGVETPVDIRLAREFEPLGGDNRLSIVDASEDANVTRDAATLSALVTEYAVPGPKLGHFSAHASLGPTDSRRRFSILVDAIATTGPRLPIVVTPITLPDPDVQLNYDEEQTDGTIHQWTAASGRIVIDAADAELVSDAGTESEYGLFTFHLEDVEMVPSNSTTDPRFQGATGTFELRFSGTTTTGLKYLSR